ncbi:acetyl-CoA carboxylase biotin carboxyl carrier protein subunit [Dyadobacter tibetensis]|uniref:acetyl-CoA carboxylase biotin carboxyl carrier protein subunit n=1 Tax=Dyadobacter tibetensis TaxID=1211851 RepID=UPI0004726D4B|nr:acetyl-CoA carboxylase biotin carboxyl carrier protein subunit [Dyadobacter tibetensis]
MLKVEVTGSGAGDKRIFELSHEEGKLLINGEIFSGDLIKLSDRHYHLLWEHRSYDIDIIDYDGEGKVGKMLINGVELQTRSQTSLDLLLESMGMQAGKSKKLNVLRAPMPGLIQSLSINEGEEVAPGDNLLVLVAMKMENVLKATGSGKVKSIKVLPGEIVEKNQVLMEFH